MRVLVLAAAAALVAGAAAAEAQQPARQGADGARQGGRVVYVCDPSDTAWRRVEREQGPIVTVTADELARAQAAGETWPAPRCITEAELQRYEMKAEQARRLQASAAR